MPSEFELKKQICEFGRRMHQAGFVAANDGNLSCRAGKGRYLCTPANVSKGFMTPEMICTLDDAGRQVAGAYKPTSEIKLHLQIYRERPEVDAVCHAHPPHATAFATSGVPLPSYVMPEVEMLLGQVPLAPYHTPGSQQVAESIVPFLRQKVNTILLSNHGAVAFDRDLEQAYFHLETLETYCRILLLAKQIGAIRQLPQSKALELLEIKKSLGLADPRIDGDMQPAVLAGSDDFLRGFSTRAIPQHSSGPDGHGRGSGIANMPSQAGQPQPALPGPVVATVAGRVIPTPGGLGSSSATARRRAMDDQIERLVQAITDEVVGSTAR